MHVSGLDGALPLIPHSIELDCTAVGVPGEVFADIVHDKRSVHCHVEKVDQYGFHYRIHFTPMDAGKHRVRFFPYDQFLSMTIVIMDQSISCFCVGLRLFQRLRCQRVTFYDACRHAEAI